MPILFMYLGTAIAILLFVLLLYIILKAVRDTHDRVRLLCAFMISLSILAGFFILALAVRSI